jgi:hypothetical protein
MSKLSKEDKFLDLSDYGRSLGRLFAKSLVNTRFTSIDVTLMFGITGILAIICILFKSYTLGLLLLVLKSIIDAADGELARLKNRPSYTGRYLDSIFDIFLNAGILFSIAYVFKSSWLLTALAFISLQFQGTLYNFYYVILRYKSTGGDKTSKIFEYQTPKAFPYEKQTHVNLLYGLYSVVYGLFDKLIYALDASAFEGKTLPKWFMSIVSVFGLGFSLLLIGLLLVSGLGAYINLFFISLTLLVFILIAFRKLFLK